MNLWNLVLERGGKTMHLKTFLMILVVAAVVTSTVMAQTVGIGSTNRGYTSQASAAISKVVSQKTDIQM